jgi:hypothetical protein
MFMQNEMLDHMVAYHRERIEASMRASESDRAVILKYRARLGSLLISLGERLSGDSIRDRIATSAPPVAAKPSLRLRPQGECA